MPAATKRCTIAHQASGRLIDHKPRTQSHTPASPPRTAFASVARSGVDQTDELRRIAQHFLAALEPMPAHSLAEAVAKYEAERLVTPPLSPRTIEWRRLSIRRHRELLDVTRPIRGSFRPEGVKLFEALPKPTAGLACKTLVCIASAAVAWGWRDKDDDHELRDMARMQYTPCEKFFSQDDFAKLADAFHELRTAPRWRAGSSVDALVACALTGARVSGVASWAWADVGPNFNSIRFVSKCKEQRLALGHQAAKLLARRSSEKMRSPWVFPGRNPARPVTREAVLGAMHRACELARLERGTVHQLRHTFATLAITSGVHTKVVQRVLGHSAEYMSHRYLHLLADDVRHAQDVVAQLHEGRMAKCSPAEVTDE